MNRFLKFIGFLFLNSLFFSCEDVIDIDVESGPPILAIDAWLTNQPINQTIKLRYSTPYFDSSKAPVGTGATVTVSDENGKVYSFVDPDQDGDYVWESNGTDSIGILDMEYTLNVIFDGETYQAKSLVKRVPPIDSIFVEFREEDLGFPEGYYAQVFAKDPVGNGDSYWIRTYKNGEFLNKPVEINLSYDGGFSAGSNIDGITFITPIREGINPFDEDENGDFLAPYAIGDHIKVEVLSITNEAFDYMNEVKIQIDRPGGIGELFASPIFNVTSNIENINGNNEDKPLGFFAVSNISIAETTVVE
ncbi:DUF4249 domain-containing protein [Flexithrix dorotheae]|uniref:DUF4249 domain-containing protein n=1 Tax=Flexithrix dorotheae TaxID=70993 RepID=UPI00035ED13A|nr:DUF4249 domain-containing protein [Flexithrix dorotheae]